MVDKGSEEGEAPCPHPPSSNSQTTQRRPTPDHPPYALMVAAALRALGEMEKEGSTEASISSYIQSNYSSLPWGHSKLLPYYLQKLVAAREISNPSLNRYSLFVHSSSPRKRGRPPKFPKLREVEPPPVSKSSPPARPRLVIRLKRIEGDSNGNPGGSDGGGWRFLKGVEEGKKEEDQ